MTTVAQLTTQRPRNSAEILLTSDRGVTSPYPIRNTTDPLVIAKEILEFARKVMTNYHFNREFVVLFVGKPGISERFDQLAWARLLLWKDARDIELMGVTWQRPRNDGEIHVRYTFRKNEPATA